MERKGREVLNEGVIPASVFSKGGKLEEREEGRKGEGGREEGREGEKK